MLKENIEKKLPRGISQRKDGRYMGRFEYQGEKYTLYDMNLKKLVKAMENRKYEVEHGLYMKEENITVAKWFDIWINEYKKYSVKKGTIVTYTQTFNELIKGVLGNKKLKDVRTDSIQKLLNDLFDKGYSKSRVTLPHVVLLGMYKQAVKNGIVSKNPAENIDIPKFKMKKERRVMSLEEQKMFIDYAKDSRYYDFYVIALCTGMRIGEISALEWPDINFTTKEITISGTLVYLQGSGERFKDTPKSNTSARQIPMLENVDAILKKIRRDQLELKLLLRDKWQPYNELNNLVFTDGFGKPMWGTGLRFDIAKIVELIQVENPSFEKITPHTFRHTFATRGLENGISPKVMQTILGHSTMAMTMDLYSHVLPNTKAKEIEKIANIF